ncbi:MAG: polysaccharide biosynthesis C-terminal domain-containing protein [Ruminococcus sp.]|nr:polysaccharide biosynthesis C-terminal domain-containing protein [Ruminococcus sp.]
MQRISQTKLNIASSVLLQVVSGVCGLILPRFVLRSFGSEVNGLVASVSQLLSYAVLLEGGIGGVMKAALYKPLANEDDAGISGIFYQISRTFRRIALIFIGFAVILSICMKFLVDTQYDWFYVFTMVLILSSHTLCSYYGSMPHRILMTADQKLYIIQFTQIVATVLNLLLCLLVMHLGGSIHTMKLVSGVVFLLNPLMQRWYVKRHYHLAGIAASAAVEVKQKRDGLVHHLSYFIHRNTDVVILSLLGSLQIVSVYTVYHTVINVLEQLLLSISSGLSGLVGRLIARKEITELNRIVDRYETCNNALATGVATVCAILILPFVSIYTGGVTDVQYHQPMFAMLIIAASYAYSIRHPFGNVVNAAGHYKETKAGAVGEMVLNLGLSLALMKPLGLAGVALGTLVAMSFRTIYTVWYLSKHILYRPVRKFFLKLGCNLLVSGILIIRIPVWVNIAAADIVELFICAIKVSVIVFPVFAGLNILISLKHFRTMLCEKNG